MNGAAPSQASRKPSGLRLTATECQDGEVELFINLLERGNHDHRERSNRFGKERIGRAWRGWVRKWCPATSAASPARV